MEKLHDYEGLSGRIHKLRDTLKERITELREHHPQNIFELVKKNADEQLKGNISAAQDFSHIYRPKTRLELIRASAAVMGIEFSYAAETAFVSPTLLQIGVDHQSMTLVWALSPIIGFFLCPILGSLSDRCKLNLGRRRPFILLLSFGVFLGLLLVPNGEDLGYWFGDPNTFKTVEMNSSNETDNSNHTKSSAQKSSHPLGIFFTILGTVLLDFDADACQSPCRAYLLDVCIPDDHASGLSTFTIMAGLGGFMGYSMGGINWDATFVGERLGGHVKAVFTIVTFIFIICVSFTVTSFKEMPLWILTNPKKSKISPSDQIGESEGIASTVTNYGTLDENINNHFELTTSQTEQDIKNTNNCEYTYNDETQPCEPTSQECDNEIVQPPVQSLSHYLLSIIHMPHSLRMLCLTNLFCWMAHVCYSLYFTDFVGEAVFRGDPKASYGSLLQTRYEEGVRFGCWGMAMYSLSCACYSLIIEKLISHFKAKRVYVGGLLFYCIGMILMAATKAKFSVIIFSWSAGVLYSTLFTLPYLLVAHYHATGTFVVDDSNEAKYTSNERGLGTDVAIVSSMVFLAQFILSICMGTIVSATGTTTSVVYTASFLSFCGAIAATKVMYLNL